MNLRVNPTVKNRAEEVLSRLGIPMSTAINIYLNQISLTGSIPFAVALPQVPNAINADMMTNEQLHIIDLEPEHSRGMRKMPVDHYSVFYIIKDDRVIVTDVLYCASDIGSRLKV